ncbi:MAG: YjbH domain-containing protein [Pseudotabrizicola sp.]|uniref:YjbH domain-containing protein n=2 Tax=Paracoccaceae TaxID=31989 RepID=UPI0027304166|nr:YjbH domain-containing protein [Pseudotabrizicola sp.]MDP2083348.1 YjbH domain-containing protein [Pseudotabrizicola sp.]MDZ7574886.1 YjbH domain-containing protein [Pseudotabrizicola sp.]
MIKLKISTAVVALVAAGALATTAALTETRPTLNMYGATGLIDMPSAEMQPDGILSGTSSHFGPISRTTLTFQITPRISGSFRFQGIRDWNKVLCCDGVNQFETYYDRSFDLRYKILDEGRYLPAIAIGLQDFVGTGVIAGEYVVATKHVTPDVKVSAGLGWGRLGSFQSIGSPLGDRPELVIGKGGNFNFGQWFRGPAAPFAGVEWQINDQWTAKAEYSSDAYDEESRVRGTFDRRSPLNFGVEYQRNESLRVGAYYMSGSEFGIAAHFIMNPKKRAGGGIATSAPDPVDPRPSRGANPEAWSTTWLGQPEVQNTLRVRLTRRLEKDGVQVESVRFDGSTAYVRIRNLTVDAEAQAVGRTARALTKVAPASVEQFVIVPMVNGMPVSQVVLQRSDIEALEFDTQAGEKILARAQILSAPAVLNDGIRDPEAYPKFTWSLVPMGRLRVFDQNSPFKAGAGLELNGRYEVTPGLILSGSVSKFLFSNLDDRPPLPERGRLQPVRSANYFYDRDGDPAIETLALTYYRKLAPELYGRMSLGYLERMHGGLSTEVLWMPTARRWAIGAEVNYTAQRSPDQRLGFSLPVDMYETDLCTPDFATAACGARNSYRVVTGHVSGYYKFDNNFHAQVDIGRYLAGDVGATLSLKREFDNGWKVGAFVTKTNVSAEDFGSGSFDKGITVEVPFASLLGIPSTKTRTTVLRPFGRDGGQRLDVDGRLYETVRGYRADGLTEQWGRFWK